MLALGGRAGAADDLGSDHLGQLPGNRADGARGRRHIKRLARGWSPQLESPDIGGETGHSEHRDGVGDRAEFRVDNGEPPASGDEAVLLPGQKTPHDVAFAESWVGGFVHDPDHPNRHRLADGKDRLNSSHQIWVAREVDVSHHHIARSRCRDRGLVETKDVGGDRPLGPPIEQDT